MKKDLTEVIFILDRSGSMSGLEKDTIGGFNSMMEKQKNESGELIVSTVLFNDTCKVLHDRVPAEQVSKLTEKDYYVCGCTALLDAVGGAIHHIGNVHKYARPEDRPEKTVVIITTDGMENASTKYSYDKVKRMIDKEQEKYGWEFIFLGANIDVTAEAERFGIGAERAVAYRCDSVGTATNYDAINDAIISVRKNKSIDKSWRKKIDDDFKKRG
ncbi:MAG: hypothetical protein PUB87_01435 [Eubacteriaceae bacterium]|nr:hypothetical protein [Eubacteriaceae bacterium]